MDNQFSKTRNLNILPIHHAGIIFTFADNGRSLQKNRS